MLENDQLFVQALVANKFYVPNYFAKRLKFDVSSDLDLEANFDSLFGDKADLTISFGEIIRGYGSNTWEDLYQTVISKYKSVEWKEAKEVAMNVARSHWEANEERVSWLNIQPLIARVIYAGVESAIYPRVVYTHTRRMGYEVVRAHLETDIKMTHPLPGVIRYAACYAVYEIQGSKILEEAGLPLFFLPMFSDENGNGLTIQRLSRK